MKTVLRIPVIASKVHLGCLPAERVKTQKIETEIRITFSEPPPVCKDDNLKGIPCYADMSHSLEKMVKTKHYASIEHLGMDSFETIRTYLKKFPKVKISELHVNLNKVQPPIKAIKAGSHFSVTDKL